MISKQVEKIAVWLFVEFLLKMFFPFVCISVYMQMCCCVYVYV